MPLGVSLPPSTITGTYEETYSTLEATAGANVATFTAVPAGEVWVIEGATAYDTVTVNTSILIRVLRAAAPYAVAARVPSAARDAAQIYSPLTLFPGDALSFLWNGCALHDDLYANAVGVKFAIELF